MTTTPVSAAAAGLPRPSPAIPGLYNVRSRGLGDLAGGLAFIAEHTEVVDWLALWPADGRPHDMSTATIAGDRAYVLSLINGGVRS